MRLTTLGCAGGIGGRERLTTCFRVDDDVLIDAGTGITVLGTDDLVRIDHVFVTHSHIDHVAGLAFLLDAVLGRRSTPITVHATAAVIAALREHLFNWVLWPDFTQLPHPSRALLRFEACAPEVAITLQGRSLTPFVVDHTVPTVGYQVVNENGGFAFSGDLSSSPALWSAIAAEARVGKVFVDCSFPDSEARIAGLSKHYCPRALADELSRLRTSVEVWITHLKPGCEDLIVDELRRHAPERRFHSLRQGDTFTF